MHRISITGASEHKLNNKIVAYSTYNERRVTLVILFRAKNFLVFQETSKRRHKEQKGQAEKFEVLCMFHLVSASCAHEHSIKLF